MTVFVSYRRLQDGRAGDRKATSGVCFCGWVGCGSARVCAAMHTPSHAPAHALSPPLQQLGAVVPLSGLCVVWVVWPRMVHRAWAEQAALQELEVQ